MTSQVSDPCALRRVPVGSIDRHCVRIPAVRVESGWQVEVEGRWFAVVGEPVLVGSGEDQDGGRVQLLVTGPDIAAADLLEFRRGERVWTRAPQPDAVETLGCANPDCAAPGPYTLTDEGLLCAGHLADYALAALPAADDEQEADRG